MDIIVLVPRPRTKLSFAMSTSLAADPSDRGESTTGHGQDGADVRAGGGSMDEDLEDRTERQVEAPQGYQHGSGAGGLSTEDIQKVVAAVAAVLGGTGHGKGTVFNTGRSGGEDNRVLLEEKFFRNMDKFEGSVEGWNAWVFNLNTQVGGVSRKVAQCVEKVLTDKGKVAWRRAIPSVE